MNQDNQNKEKPKAAKTIKTTITCQHCGEKQEIEIEIPEAQNTPKVAWQG
jgi:hypothetical protein